MQTILIVAVAFGVLNLILFFKIWGMTNDVKRICRHTEIIAQKRSSAIVPDESGNQIESDPQASVEESTNDKIGAIVAIIALIIVVISLIVLL